MKIVCVSKKILSVYWSASNRQWSQIFSIRYTSNSSNSKETSLISPSALNSQKLVKDDKFAFTSRSDLVNSQRLVVKLGSAVLTRTDQGGIALGRLASIVEQVAELHADGKEVMIVTSGAVAFGRQRLGRELMMSQSVRETIRSRKNENNTSSGSNRNQVDSRSCAAAGQSGLMSLYESMFAQYNISTAQVLVSKRDLERAHRSYLQSTLDNLLALSIVPIINTNDAVVPPPDPEIDVDGAISIKDNDSLAARLAVLTNTDLLVLVSNVEGLFTAPPGAENSKLLHTYSTNTNNMDGIEFGKKSSVGLGGMDSKVQAAVWSLEHGTSVVICNGCAEKGPPLVDIVGGRKVGTFFTEAPCNAHSANSQAEEAREGSRELQQLTTDKRVEILHRLADLLEEREQEIMSANHMDVALAKKGGTLSQALMDRLVLSPARIRELAKGVRQVAEKSSGLVGKILTRRQLAAGLVAEQVSVPIGVLMVIFESRPDCLPQIASLAIATSNGILLKGGRESAHANKCLHQVVQDALALYHCQEAAQLVETREEVSDIIQDATGLIDLIIPRGSSEMVHGIQQMAAGTSVPVLGHSEGICHVYVDKNCSASMATRVVQDAKCNYPAACNAMETLLIHKDLMHSSVFKEINDVLQAEDVTIHLGPKLASRLLFFPSVATSMRKEYSALECCIEVVDSLEKAVQHIRKYGSGHTDTIVTNNEDAAQYFLENVDSACVFHNTSTRFADGQRMGLGAEVGVSTTRIHARGPVGAEGLLTYKWIVRGDGHTVHDFSPDGTKQFDHHDLPL
ncbi:unnamed protein product [Clavelina lepadiformis]|uniref:Delta-1-pyrroline-5-carboxylate synthase n=1 Tax=Clavelina lepadiformis TaxID=159417 RepID=A0ABP0FFY1_CLALP